MSQALAVNGNVSFALGSAGQPVATIVLEGLPTQARPQDRGEAPPGDLALRPGGNLTRPTTTEIMQNISDGRINLHVSRHPLKAPETTTLMTNIQKGLGLKWGRNGTWNAIAQSQLEKLLASEKVRRGVKREQLAIEDVKKKNSSRSHDKKKSCSSW